MQIDKKSYRKYADARAQKSPCAKNCINAFLYGGFICVIAQGLKDLYMIFLTEKDAGTLVPITGFSNAVASSALDAKGEGFVLGVGAKIFTIAGPVILYGITAGAVYGVIYYIITLII